MASRPAEVVKIDFDKSSTEFDETVQRIYDKANRYMKSEELDFLNNLKKTMSNLFHELFDLSTQPDNQSSKLDKILSLIEPKSDPNFPPLQPTNYAHPNSALKPTTTKSPKQTILVHPKKDKQIDAATIFEITRKHVYNKKTKSKIIKIQKNKSNVAIITEDPLEADAIVTELSKEPNLSDTNIFIAKKLDPCIKIRDVSKFYDTTDLIQDLLDYNNFSGETDNFRLLFCTERRSDFKDLIMRVSPSIYQQIKSHGFKLFLPGQQCSVDNKYFVKQCQKCYLFGHKSTECKRPPMCHVCGTESSNNHKCSSVQQCVNCAYFNSKNPNSVRPTDHKPNNKECPYFSRQLKKAISNTNYSL